MTDAEIREKLAACQRLISELNSNLRKAEAIRDGLIQRLLDNDGAHDRRPVAVR